MGTSHEATPYNHIKTTVLQRKSVSVRRRIQQLLNEEDLGEQRPSELLCRMKQLLSDSRLDANSPLRQELFFERLPQNVVLALAAAPDNLPLDKLAEQADRVAGYAAGGTVAAASSVPLSQLENRPFRLEQLIDGFAETVNALRPPSHPRRRDHDYRPRFWKEKTVTIELNGHEEVVKLDIVKSAYLATALPLCAFDC
ncbi:hypothetical protein HPB52_008526 [Rhipicephalus sanguineus]|uniref:Uncharacterized protein n=1 Tax=Rhipicephalus sanguineus TaxID=34632 RepID=A0A9D4QF81_RHISA|nr:hypothetical protein HPB52_008526 [Rhipicephalus sanguineus]